MTNKNIKYKPTVSKEYAEKLQKWQESVYKESKTRDTQNIEFLGRKFSIPRGIHPINPMSDLLGNSVLKETKSTDKVLDMGTGSGVNAILAASKASNIIAVDINPEAIKNAEQNAKVNGVSSKITFAVSDVFSNVKGVFNLIIFDPPFRWFTPRDIYELGTTDEGYNSLTTFFQEVEKHLKPDGRILLCFGSSGDIGYLYKLIEEHKFQKKVTAQRDLTKEDITVNYYTFLLTRLNR